MYAGMGNLIEPGKTAEIWEKMDRKRAHRVQQMNLPICSVPKTQGWGKPKMCGESGQQTNSFHDLGLITPQC